MAHPRNRIWDLGNGCMENVVWESDQPHPLHGGRNSDNFLNSVPESLDVVPPVQDLLRVICKQQQTNR